MTTRVARCGCGRVQATVEGEPHRIYVCRCDFCQKRSGTSGTTSAWFGDDQVLEIIGETKVYNGLEIDGVGAAKGGLDISYHFCPTCGSTVFFTISEIPGVRGFAVGSFVDPDFPPPTDEYWSELRHSWIAPIPDAVEHERF